MAQSTDENQSTKKEKKRAIKHVPRLSSLHATVHQLHCTPSLLPRLHQSSSLLSIFHSFNPQTPTPTPPTSASSLLLLLLPFSPTSKFLSFPFLFPPHTHPHPQILGNHSRAKLPRATPHLPLTPFPLLFRSSSRSCNCLQKFFSPPFEKFFSFLRRSSSPAFLRLSPANRNLKTPIGRMQWDLLPTFIPLALPHPGPRARNSHARRSSNWDPDLPGTPTNDNFRTTQNRLQKQKQKINS
ncbi:hypothetical protein FB451DRAFT_1388503 [Mycena latifolia]|nr:hypothetical protein FB451DRAFT_1388503 [Mycena latifolia]